jgi:RNA polymerase sigma factor (sigma-70 family)
MPDPEDSDLLRKYAERQSEAAFRELVERHVNFVYTVAMRYVGNPLEAQDVAQAVFITLARKSAALCHRTTLTGWLYETTRFASRQLLRTKARQFAREQETYSTNEMERYSSFNVLQRIGSAADPALPAILDHIQHDPSDGMRSFGLTTLGNSGIGQRNPEVVVPILIECPAPTNKAILRGETLRALPGLGASAKSAVPAILPYLKDPTPELRTAARNALSQIDPAAAM